jgi:hypothetical protein
VETIIRKIEETVSASDASAAIEEETVESVPVEFDVASNTSKAGGGGTIHIGS